jgi:hypothetical protein
MLTRISFDKSINSHKNNKMAYYDKMTCTQTCSNYITNLTDGFVGFFYPNFIYNMHMFLFMKCSKLHIYTLPKLDKCSILEMEIC